MPSDETTQQPLHPHEHPREQPHGPATTDDLGPVVITAHWLVDHLDDVVVADVRWYLDGRSGRAAHEHGHLPGAVWVDLDDALAAHASPADGRHPLPDPAHLAVALGRAGIPDDAHVVAYDDAGPFPGAGGTGAARLVWMLRALGQRASLLDGGIRAWTGPLTTGPTTRPPVTRRVRTWAAGAVVGADAAAAAPLLVDVRAGERYRGETEPIDPRAGHIAGAVNLPDIDLLDATGRLLPADELRARFEAVGVGAGSSPVVYCGSGVTASHALLALEVAGLGPGRLYAGSWSQWSNDPARAVTTGADPG